MVFEETQRFPLTLLVGIGVFILLLAAVMSIFVIKTDRLASFAAMSALFIPVAALFLLFKLETLITAEEITVRLAPLSGRSIGLAEISEVEAITYQPLRDFGGWGIRKGRGGTMYNARGNDAVKLSLRSGEVVYIGTERPEKLVETLSAR